MKCPDCNGTGKYEGLFKSEECKTCGGKGNTENESNVKVEKLRQFPKETIVKYPASTMTMPPLGWRLTPPVDNMDSPIPILTWTIGYHKAADRGL